MISKLFGMKHPIVKVSLFSGNTFQFEFHPLLVKFSKTDEFMDTYWIVMNKFYRLTKRVVNTKI